jgi:hypothetical protein
VGAVGRAGGPGLLTVPQAHVGVVNKARRPFRCSKGWVELLSDVGLALGEARIVFVPEERHGSRPASRTPRSSLRRR